MPYKIGVSSGWWHIDKPPDLLGLATKVGGFGGTAGVQFIQVDLDTTSEFFEPRVEEQLKRVKKKLNIEVGLHAEIGELMALESAERRLWEQSHLRLIETVRHAADFGLTYVLIHLSTRPQLYYLEREYRIMGYMYPIVDFLGRPLYDICEESKDAKEIAQKNLIPMGHLIHADARTIYEETMEKAYEREYYRRVGESHEALRRSSDYIAAGLERKRMMEMEEETKISHEIAERRRVEMPEKLYEVWKQAPNACYHMDTAEIAAYKIIGAYMRETGDPLWTSLCNGKEAEEAYQKSELHPGFNAAVAARYLQGHLEVKNHEYNKKYLNGMSILEWLKKKNMFFLFETPEAHPGTEALLRLFNPLDAYLLIKKLGSEKLKLCIDFEHMLAHKLNVDAVIKKLPGSAILLFHLGKPVPYFGTAHAPIPIGSRSQEVLYKWIYELRKSGFKDGYMIYERGGGKTALDIMQNSVWVMRQMAKYLEKDVPFEDLPPEFYGVAEQTKETFARQLVAMRDHAWDPLEGLLMVPEEKHTFLSKSAVEKGKREEWEKRKYR